MKNLYLPSTLVFLSAVSMPAAHAAQQPDAGRTLQELRPAPALPATSQPPIIQSAPTTTHAHGGMRMQLADVTITGNTQLTEAELLAALGEVRGKSFDLAGLKTLADKITAYYHTHNYPFARAFIPPQALKNGVLHIEVIEGRYGKVTISGTDARADAAQKFLGALQPGDVIDGKKLERTSLILDDQPGYKFTPIIRPGQKVGTGDLNIEMKRAKRYGGNVSIDNGGNRYTGKVRGLANAYADSPFMFGDKVTLSTIYTEEDMWYGAAGYSMPLGASGLRGNVGYTHTYYELGKEFSPLDAHGTAKIASTGLSYPLLRSQQANLSLAATYQHKWLTDEQGIAGTTDKKGSDVLPVALNFDARDGFGGGGVSYGALSWTHGSLDLGSTLRAADRFTANSNGSFDKFNLDAARLQATSVENLVLFGRVAGQLSGGNLDSSEDFGLGGPNGVRAYPAGESYGDEGLLAQAELRYTIDMLTPYVFYDYGTIRTNHSPWTTGANGRQVGGGGVGMRAAYKNWNADASAAWRTNGGSPQSDSEDNMPQLWVTVGYTF